LRSSFFFHIFARNKPETEKIMKKTIVCLLGVLVACSLTLTAFAACGDDDEPAVNGNGEVCVVAVLPKSIAPSASLEVTYYDAQGAAKSFTVRDGETSDAVPSYSKQAMSVLELLLGFTIDYNSCIVRTQRFTAPTGATVSCKSKVVLTGVEPTDFPTKTFAPFAAVTAMRSNGEVVPGNSISLSSQTFSSLESFVAWIQRLGDRERTSSITIN
jgi:hypothetical protein